MRNYLLLLTFVLIALASASRAQTPKTAEDFYKRGEERSGSNDVDGAIADYTKAIELDPKFAAAYCARAHTRPFKKDYAVIADWDKCISLKPADDKYLFTDYLERGEAKADMKDYEGAIADSTKSIDLRPSHWAYQDRSHAYSEKYLIDRQNKRSRKAKEDFEKALADFDWLMKKIPNYDLYYRQRGQLYSRAGHYSEAIGDYTKAIELEPKNAEVYKLRAEVYRKLGKKNLAEADEKKAAELGKK